MLVFDSPALRPNRPFNPPVQAREFGLFRVRSPLLAESLLFSLPAGTEMVHFPALPSRPYVFRPGYGGITRRGLPHSDIPGSKLVCSSPRLFAAYCVLHRLLAPRHSPYALSSLTIGIIDNFQSPLADREMQSSMERSQIINVFPPSLNTAVFVDRKNYRLQDIQLSKILRGASPLELPDSLTRGDPSIPAPFARAHSLFARAPRVCVASFAPHSLKPSSPELSDSHENSAPTVLACLAEAAREASAQRRLVENTGLEPVTSWLQTRRSPS